MISKPMKYRVLILLTLFVTCVHCSFSQNQSDEMKYRRSSLYSVLIRHPEKDFGNDIDTVFRTIPIPTKFNDHNLKIKAINATIMQKNNNRDSQNIIDYTINPFLEKNDIAKRLVSKWFNRKEGKGKDGTFDMNLIIERGLYDADHFAAQLAGQSVRGQSLLADAGEELIGQTFVVFNDIRYFDKEEASAWAAMGIAVAGMIASEFTGGLTSLAISYGSTASSKLTAEIAGFRVSITSYLFQLVWDEESSATFYQDYYISEANEAKKEAYNKAKDLFHLKYVGSYSTVSSETTLRGVQSKNDMIRKVCERAIDKNIAQLQKEYEVFRVKTPLFSTEPLTAKIGLKEDIDEKTKFEVLEAIEDDNGVIRYKRVGIIRPVKGKIWDNRFMAEFEEENEGNTRTATEFEVVSGSGFYPGMLLRQIN
jgi:hypothetical protein